MRGQQKYADCFMTLEEIAKELGCSRERVRQIEDMVLLKLERLNPKIIKQLRIDFNIAPPKKSASDRLLELSNKKAVQNEKWQTKNNEAQK